MLTGTLAEGRGDVKAWVCCGPLDQDGHAALDMAGAVGVTRVMSEILLLAAGKRGVPVPPPPHDAAALGELAAAIFCHPTRAGRRVPREEAYLAYAARMTLPTRHGALAAWLWGGEEEDRPLIGLVHGWEGHGAQLGAFAAPLVAAGFRVLTFDAPGHGESPGDEAHVPMLARVLPDLQAATAPFFGLIGHSMGAAAAAMATTLGVRARGLVLLAPPLSLGERVERTASRMQLAPEVRRFSPRWRGGRTPAWSMWTCGRWRGRRRARCWCFTIPTMGTRALRRPRRSSRCGVVRGWCRARDEDTTASSPRPTSSPARWSSSSRNERDEGGIRLGERGWLPLTPARTR
jgi:pimeloyl-ACP methyl ester carboxylesterase